MIKVPRLEAEGVVLRQLELSDAASMYLAHSDEQTQLHRRRGGPMHTSVQQTRDYIQTTLDRKGAHTWAVTEAGGEALGRIALYVERDGVGEFGIILRREAQGRGMASSAVKLVAEYGFNQLALHRLMADIDPDNSSSLTLFLRNGFHREGVLKQNWKTHLGLRDSVIMAKLKDAA